MSVVNIRSGEPYDIYIGRPGKGLEGRWGSPFRLSVNEERGATIERYRAWLWAEIGAGRISLGDLASLHGKMLGCFCKPAPCHGDVLEAAAAWAVAQL